MYLPTNSAEDPIFEKHSNDGVHVNGPASYGVIRNVHGSTGDDLVALNSWDWGICGIVPSFGSIDHVLAEGVNGTPKLGTLDLIRLLPGTKTFSNGRKLDCPVADCVFRDLRDIRAFKIYDQPYPTVPGRGTDYCDPIGTIKNIYFERLIYNSQGNSGRFQIAADVDGLSVNDVQLNFDLRSPDCKDFKLIEIGPMSQTFKVKPNNPYYWGELFSPDKDVTVRKFRLTNVRVKTGNGMQLLPNAEAVLVKIADQKPNPDYPKTTPRGGKGKAIVIP